MKNIIIFSGTTEGRELSEKLAKAGISHMVSVATEYGELVMTEHPLVKIHHGRLGMEEMKDLILEQQIDIVVDATHPYAIEVTRTIRSSVESLRERGTSVRYLRLERNLGNKEELHFFKNDETCRMALEQIQGNILLTTGSKELHEYCKSQTLKNRLYVRVLPGIESLSICRKQEIHPSKILALQGPFSVEMNLAFIKQYQITCMVSKQGGVSGGFPEKKAACEQAGIPLYVIQKEDDQNATSAGTDNTYDFYGICDSLEELLGVGLCCEKQAKLKVTLAGVGMGSNETLTLQVTRAIGEADLIVGAKRVIEPFIAKYEKKDAYIPTEIMEWLQEKSVEYSACGELTVVILFSGDSGFYSGCQKVREMLEDAMDNGILQGTVRTYPGISSIQAMAAGCGISWQDAGIYSIHGRNRESGWEKALLDQIHQYETLFLLVSGPEDVRMLGKTLSSEDRKTLNQQMYSQTKQTEDNEDLKIYVGYQLSYPEEEIKLLTSAQCKDVNKEGLYSILIQNLGFKNKTYPILTHGLNDSEFLRGKVPMTKEEVREVVICKLHLQRESICYDIGSGTGSIAVEIARLDPYLKVFAVEQKKEAVELLMENKEKFRCGNMEIVEGIAPEALQGLEPPTHVVVGGTGGHLMEILKCLYEKKQKMRVVLTAISLDTVAEFSQIKKNYSVEDFEMIQMQVNRYQKLGAYQMPKAENPIVICSFQFMA